MKITLTLNEALALISEGMTMNNCKSLANKLRNADAPVAKAPEMSPAYNNAIEQLEKAKETETTLRKALADEGERLSRMASKIRDLENDAERLGEIVSDRESRLVWANDVIATVKAAYDLDEFDDDKIALIKSAVEGYYLGN